MSQRLDLLAVGDIVTEPFIKLLAAESHCDEGKGSCTLCMEFGAKLPYESATLVPAVGNAANAAVSAARLGLATALRAYTGDDRYGTEMFEALAAEGVSTEHMVTEPGKESNYHYVLWYGNERTILVKHELFAYALPERIEGPKWLYLTSLAANSLPYQEALVGLLDTEWTDTLLAFQPGTFQLEAGAEACKRLYARADIVFCNKEEAGHILGLATNDIGALLEGMHALGSKVVVITDGTQGAYASDGTQAWRVPLYPDTRGPYERTGAGDAFASTVVAALALGKSLEEALLWGPINSMAVVQEVGAQKGLLPIATLEHFRETAPADYALTAL